MYDVFLNSTTIKQNYIDKWCLDINIEKDDISYIFINKLPFIVTKDPKLCWFQYRLLHRILPTNVLLFKMKIKDTTSCAFCNTEEETLLHLFFHCNIVNKFWGDLLSWIELNANTTVQFEKETIIFGKKFRKCGNCLNLILLLAKQFIFTQKIRNRPLDVDAFTVLLKNYFMIEKYIFAKNNKLVKFYKRWEILKHKFE